MKRTSRLHAFDLNLQQLAVYVRNCMAVPFAHRLQRPLFRAMLRLKGKEEDGDEFDSAKGRHTAMQELRQVLKRYSAAGRSDDPLEPNVFFARDEFGLDQIETEILLLTLRYVRNSEVETLFDEVHIALRNRDRSIACMIGAEVKAVHDRLNDEGLLISSGVLAAESCGSIPDISPPLERAMKRPHRCHDEWAASIFGNPLTPSLTWDDFEHLGVQRDLAARLLVGAGQPGAQARSKGLNLLFHGPVGTGKTEFCKVLAARTGRAIWAVGEKDDDGDEPGRGKRLASLRLAQRLLANRPDAMLLFDEAEDILAPPMSLFGSRERSRSESKVFINRTIEENVVPVLWTCNDLDEMDAAVRRRMALAIEVRTPDAKVRARILRRALAQSGLPLAGDAVERLARRYEMPPSVAVNAVRAAELAGGGEAEIEQAMSGILRILGIAPLPLESGGSDFALSLTNCTEDLGRFTERLLRPNAPVNWSLCIHGAPGTGKSRFARHLAERQGMEVVQKRASDLLSMWVGESEHNIAGAFAEARARRAMLILDEADSLLADRRGAVRSWEVTQVNEMLTWMENHPLPFVCTTNLIDRLDRASLRRFTFKLRFEALTSDQAGRAFVHFFGIPSPPFMPDGLTPGDFATVRRKRELIGANDPETLAEWLAAEVEARDARASVIGFLPPGGSK